MESVIDKGESNVINDVLAITLHSNVTDIAAIPHPAVIKSRVLAGSPREYQAIVAVRPFLAQQGHGPGSPFDHHNAHHGLNVVG